MDIPQIRQRLQASLELTCARNNLILYAAAAPVMTLVTIFATGHPEFWPLAVALSLALFLPFIIFYALRIARIFRSPEHYRFCRCVLAQPHPGFLRHTMYYTVLLEDPDGRKFPADTHAIFYARGSFGPTVEDFTNKTVTIAYNPETDMVVVVG